MSFKVKYLRRVRIYSVLSFNITFVVFKVKYAGIVGIEFCVI